jgi:hypothetical protein
MLAPVLFSMLGNELFRLLSQALCLLDALAQRGLGLFDPGESFVALI